MITSECQYLRSLMDGKIFKYVSSCNIKLWYFKFKELDVLYVEDFFLQIQSHIEFSSTIVIMLLCLVTKILSLKVG